MRTPRSLVISVALGFALVLWQAPAFAQGQCGPREHLVKSLGDRFKEAPVGMGITQPGQIVELFTSDTGSWTMVLTTPNGTSCLIAAGESWDTIQRAKGTPT